VSITVRFNAFDSASVQSAIQQLERLRMEQDDKVQNACMRIAEYGATRAQTDFSSAVYDGNNDVTVTAEQTALGARVVASGEAVLFIEYGAGVTMGYGHPRPMGYGPGTYNPTYPTAANPNWRNPNGWYYAHGRKSWGNPPAAAMYHAEQDMYYRAYEIANGVFDR
jgi:hypothetical protein